MITAHLQAAGDPPHMNVQLLPLKDQDLVTHLLPVVPLGALLPQEVDLPQGVHPWEMAHPEILLEAHQGDHLGRGQEEHHLHLDVEKRQSKQL